MTLTEVVPKLFIGRIEDAATFDGDIISVYETLWDGEPRKALWIPILMDGKAKKQQLNMVAFAIHTSLANNRPVLVHCHQGIERSPLAVAFYLRAMRGITMKEAYEFIKSKRPEIVEHLDWLEFDPDENFVDLSKNQKS